MNVIDRILDHFPLIFVGIIILVGIKMLQTGGVVGLTGLLKRVNNDTFFLNLVESMALKVVPREMADDAIALLNKAQGRNDELAQMVAGYVPQLAAQQAQLSALLTEGFSVLKKILDGQPNVTPPPVEPDNGG